VGFGSRSEGCVCEDDGVGAYDKIWAVIWVLSLRKKKRKRMDGLATRKGGGCAHDEPLVHFDCLVHGSGHGIFMDVFKVVWRKILVKGRWDDFR
jgi:hypothetical protein